MISQKTFQFVGFQQILKHSIQGLANILHQLSPSIGLDCELEGIAHTHPVAPFGSETLPLELALNSDES